jgi:hypothetical protein
LITNEGKQTERTTTKINEVQTNQLTSLSPSKFDVLAKLIQHVVSLQIDPDIIHLHANLTMASPSPIRRSSA